MISLRLNDKRADITSVILFIEGINLQVGHAPPCEHVDTMY